MIDVSMTGAFLCAQASLPHMRSRNYGRILSFSSMSWRGNFGQASYVAAKAGIVGLIRIFVLTRSGLRVLCRPRCGPWARYRVSYSVDVSPSRWHCAKRLPVDLKVCSSRRSGRLHTKLRRASSASEPMILDVVAWSKNSLGIEVLDHHGQTEHSMVNAEDPWTSR